MAYSDAEKGMALEIYKTTGRNMSATSRQTEISRPTLIRWSKEGEPTKITGGKSWDKYLDKKEEVQVQKAKKSALEDKREFVRKQRDRTSEMLDHIYSAVVADQTEIKISDYDKIVRLHMLLDGVEQDKADFMNMFVASVVDIIADVVNEQQFAQIKSRLMSLMQNKRDNMDVLPPTMAESQVVED